MSDYRSDPLKTGVNAGIIRSDIRRVIVKRHEMEIALHTSTRKYK